MIDEQMPMRHEEYLAMSEQNRRLVAENTVLNEKLGTKKTKIAIPRPRGYIVGRIVNATKRFLSVAVPLLLVGSVVIGLPVFGVMSDNKDKAEQKTNPICYQIGKPEGRSNPWDHFRIWEVRKGRSQNWNNLLDLNFKSEEDAKAFVKSYNVAICP